MKKILVIAAHPDDDILGCGGLMAKRKSAQFKVVFLAEGTSCRYPADEIGNPNVRAEIAKRTEFARRALQVLGVKDVVFHDYPCGRLDQIPILDLNKKIERELGEFTPDTVLTHAEHDTNNDHRIVYRSVAMATRPGGFRPVPTVMSFETQSSTEWNFSSAFEPNYFEVLSEEHLATKWRALQCYESETRPYPHPRSQEGLATLARYRGLQAGVAYAEAFRISRTIVT